MAFGLFGLTKEPLGASEHLALHVPPEEDRHEQTFMQWPVNRKVYPDPEFLNILQQTIADIANSIAEFEPVVMLADKTDHKHARKMLSSKVKLWNIPTEDLWCRDAGPLFAKTPNDKLVVSHIQFNGWGSKQVHKRDAVIASEVAKRLGVELVSSGVVGEAGGVEHDGHGLLMAHESSWVNKNRNPSLTRKEIEERLLLAYGAEQMIWSSGVWGEDITDYHIDSLARFTGPGRVLINLPDKPDMNDPFHAAAVDTHDALVAAKLEVEVIPEPEIRRVKSIDFVASYANYYACNGGVIAAQFGDKEADAIAQKALKKHYSGREVVTLNVDVLGEVGGGIHCATQQMPAT
jgi:agmatine deiminase